ncbi:rod shape-determining protein MreC [Leadbetterella byssophila]|uniref:Cell shape-determining protein MreC n=1 Tax=Leadbetterella byssophila (strain DSM 17132 / JCM 16389 / KACC 11308 / NBRC 106382 / 4M15) TaxID=649349 RepID=E4RRE8_LEAB4|nr:rod shape-determining protein MreC [Leadbetterella byssophila]ADQ18481.1 Rod shape-determining protein MreC [Leadbetterella byssophila DSM 17132]
MSQLFGILYKSRHFFLFLALQIVCFYLMSKNNVYWDVSFFNTTNTVVARSLEVSQKANEFVSLGKVNDQLAAENMALRKQLTDIQEANFPIPGYKQDSAKAYRFEYTVAKVVGSTHNLTDNFITIDKGTDDGVKAGMGVISPNGVVGQVAYANKHYSRVYSVLHSRQMVSAEVLNKKLREENNVALGIAKWGGVNPRYIQLTNVDRFKPVAKGDSVVTSLQNPIFPPHIMIGKISDVSNTTSEAFHTINVRLSTDFSGLVYVYVVKNKLIESQQEAENNSSIK